MRFIGFDEVAEKMRGKSVAVVGSGPGSLENSPGFIDKNDVVVRCNNYKIGPSQGSRCDVHFSFYGTSIRKTREDLERDGVTMCMCKCPNGRPIESDWHVRMNKLEGIDYTYIYRNREAWWFCDTFVPPPEHYLKTFDLLGRHIPTTGFSAILDVIACRPRSLYLTGFDFFTSGLHNVDEKWKPGNAEDPICHRPDLEARWLMDNATKHPIAFDKKMLTAMRAMKP